MWHLSRRTMVISHWRYWAWVILFSNRSTCRRGLTDYRCWWDVNEVLKCSFESKEVLLSKPYLSRSLVVLCHFPALSPLPSLNYHDRSLFCNSSHGIALHTGSHSIAPPRSYKLPWHGHLASPTQPSPELPSFSSSCFILFPYYSSFRKLSATQNP